MTFIRLLELLAYLESIYLLIAIDRFGRTKWFDMYSLSYFFRKLKWLMSHANLKKKLIILSIYLIMLPGLIWFGIICFIMSMWNNCIIEPIKELINQIKKENKMGTSDFVLLVFLSSSMIGNIEFLCLLQHINTVGEENGLISKDPVVDYRSFAHFFNLLATQMSARNIFGKLIILLFYIVLIPLHVIMIILAIALHIKPTIKCVGRKIWELTEKKPNQK